MGTAIGAAIPPAAPGNVFRALESCLACPVCGGELQAAGHSLRCDLGHCFDRARQGYVNMLSGGPAPGTADTSDMVRARAEFLRTGYYASLAALLAERAAPYCADGLVVDVGAGTGYYLRAVLDQAPRAVGLALDVSKFALRQAARAHPRAAAIGWDIWRPLPIRAGAASVVLNVFAPRNGAQFRRILRPDGALLVVTPTGRHLETLVPALGLLSVDADKGARLRRSLSPYFRLNWREEHDCGLRLPSAHVELLARMGPSGHHLGPREIARRAATLGETVEVTASFTVAAYLPR